MDFLRVLLPLVVIVFIIAIGVFLLNQHFQKNLFKQKLTQEEIKRSHQQELLKSSIGVQETERKRIARDLHDEMGASLSIARMQLVRLQEELVGSEKYISSIQTVLKIVESSITSVREISHRLMPVQLESLGLVKTLTSIVDQVNEGTGPKIKLKISSSIGRMPWNIELGLYRITLEFIQNTMKHANATEVLVNLSRSAHSQVELTYRDNGEGMNVKDFSGIGLRNVEARSNALGGTIEVFNGDGFNSKVVIPLKQSDDYE